MRGLKTLVRRKPTGGQHCFAVRSVAIVRQSIGQLTSPQYLQVGYKHERNSMWFAGTDSPNSQRVVSCNKELIKCQCMSSV